MPHGCELASCEWPRKDEKKSAQTRTQSARGLPKNFYPKWLSQIDASGPEWKAQWHSPHCRLRVTRRRASTESGRNALALWKEKSFQHVRTSLLV